jgi:hypothetical protein
MEGKSIGFPPPPAACDGQLDDERLELILVFLLSIS